MLNDNCLLSFTMQWDSLPYMKRNLKTIGICNIFCCVFSHETQIEIQSFKCISIVFYSSFFYTFTCCCIFYLHASSPLDHSNSREKKLVTIHFFFKNVFPSISTGYKLDRSNMMIRKGRLFCLNYFFLSTLNCHFYV